MGKRVIIIYHLDTKETNIPIVNKERYEKAIELIDNGKYSVVATMEASDNIDISDVLMEGYYGTRRKEMSGYKLKNCFFTTLKEGHRDTSAMDIIEVDGGKFLFLGSEFIPMDDIAVECLLK